MRKYFSEDYIILSPKLNEHQKKVFAGNWSVFFLPKLGEDQKKGLCRKLKWFFAKIKWRIRYFSSDHQALKFWWGTPTVNEGDSDHPLDFKCFDLLPHSPSIFLYRLVVTLCGWSFLWYIAFFDWCHMMWAYCHLMLDWSYPVPGVTLITHIKLPFYQSKLIWRVTSFIFIVLKSCRGLKFSFHWIEVQLQVCYRQQGLLWNSVPTKPIFFSDSAIWWSEGK